MCLNSSPNNDQNTVVVSEYSCMVTDLGFIILFVSFHCGGNSRQWHHSDRGVPHHDWFKLNIHSPAFSPYRPNNDTPQYWVKKKKERCMIALYQWEWERHIKPWHWYGHDLHHAPSQLFLTPPEQNRTKRMPTAGAERDNGYCQERESRTQLRVTRTNTHKYTRTHAGGMEGGRKIKPHSYGWR